MLALPAWVFGVFGLALAWRYAHEYRGLRLPGRWLRAGLMLLVVAAVWRQYGTILGRDPGFALLVALIGLKVLELRTQRDYLLVMFLLYLVLAGGFLYGQSLPLGLWAAAAVVAHLAALAWLNQPDVLGLRQAFALAAGIVLKALPIMLVLYLVFPRLGGALWGVPAGGEVALSGIPESLELGHINRLSLSDEVAFRVEFEGERLPPARERYWRVRVLARTDGREWTSGGGARAGAGAHFEGLGAPWRYTVHFEPSGKPWLAVLGLPAELPPGTRLAAEGLVLEHAEPVRSRLSYRLASFTHYRTGPLAAGERAAVLELPAALDPRLYALAARLRREARDGSAQALAQAALAYFREGGFFYTLTPPPVPQGADPLAAFLFESRRGYCEHYAAAFATLMRAAGVPSRVVIGYQGGELNPAGRYLVVRQSDAHAWAEIWTPEGGWTRVDPTAAVAPERVELGMQALRRLSEQGLAFGRLSETLLARALERGWLARLAFQARAYWDYANLAWYRWVADYDESRQQRLLERIGLGRMTAFGRALLIALAVALLLLGYALAARRWRRGGGAPERPDPAARLYARFCRKLARAGLARAPHEGPLAYAARLRSLRPELGATVAEIVGRYVELRYAPAGGGDESRRRAELRALARAVAALRVGRAGT